MTILEIAHFQKVPEQIKPVDVVEGAKAVDLEWIGRHTASFAARAYAEYEKHGPGYLQVDIPAMLRDRASDENPSSVIEMHRIPYRRLTEFREGFSVEDRLKPLLVSWLTTYDAGESFVILFTGTDGDYRAYQLSPDLSPPRSAGAVSGNVN